jgi:hypothetical protein
MENTKPGDTIRGKLRELREFSKHDSEHDMILTELRELIRGTLSILISKIRKQQLTINVLSAEIRRLKGRND